MKSEKVRKFFGLCPKNNDIRLRRVNVLQSENVVPVFSERGARGENRLCLLSHPSKRQLTMIFTL